MPGDHDAAIRQAVAAARARKPDVAFDVVASVPLEPVPTVEEACGLPGFESTSWYGLFAPPGLPGPIQQRMAQEVARVIAAPDFMAWLTGSQGITPPADPSPAAFRQVHERDIARWGEIVRRSGARVD